MKSYIKTLTLCLLAFILINPVLQAQKVYISEILYDTPLNEDYAEYGHHNGEYIELYNPANTVADITGWSLKGFYPREVIVFPQIKLAPYSYLLVVYKNAKDTYPFFISTVIPDLLIFDKPASTYHFNNYSNNGQDLEYKGSILYHNNIRLSNKGETIRLYDRTSNLVDSVVYHGNNIVGVSKPDDTGEKPLYAKNGFKGYRGYYNCVSIKRLNVIRDSEGNAVYSRNSWGYGRITPLGVVPKVMGFDNEKNPYIETDLYPSGTSPIIFDDIIPEAEPLFDILPSDGDILYTYDNSGNRVERTIFISKLKSAQSTENNDQETTSSIIEKLGEEKSIQIFPNPTKGILRIVISNPEESTIPNVSVYSLSGQLIYNANTIGGNLDIDLSSQPAGSYILNITIDKNIYTWKIIKE